MLEASITYELVVWCKSGKRIDEVYPFSAQR